MKKYFALFLSITMSAFLLSACNSSDNGEDRPSDDPRPSNDRPTFSDLEQARTLLTSQERSLERRHGYRFVYYSGLFDHIIPPVSDPIDWTERYEFYRDSLSYASSLIALKENEARFVRENENLYRDLVRKTRSMAQLIIEPIYIFSVTSLEELEGFHYDITPVEFLNFLGVKLYAYVYEPAGAPNTALEWSGTAREMCRKLSVLNQFDFDDLNMTYPGTVRSCSRYPKAKILSALSEDEPTSRAVDSVNRELLAYYDSVANQSMNASGIFLSPDFNEGYNFIARTDYEQRIVSLNSHHPISIVSVALTNNFYENVYFKIRVLRAKEYIFGSSSQIQDELDLALRAFNGLRHNEINIRLGESPFNYDTTLGSEDLSNIPSVVRRPSPNEVLGTAPQTDERPSVQAEVRPDVNDLERVLDFQPLPEAQIRNGIVDRDRRIPLEEERQVDFQPGPRAALEETGTGVELTPTSREREILTEVAPAPATEREVLTEVAPPPAQQQTDTEVVDEGNSSNAPLNDGPQPITIPEEVTDFFGE